MSNYNYEDEEEDWSEEEEDIHKLPEIVQQVLTRRHNLIHPKRSLDNGKIIETLSPEEKARVEKIVASAEVVDALRNHIKSGLFLPEYAGGYLTLLQVSWMLVH